MRKTKIIEYRASGSVKTSDEMRVIVDAKSRDVGKKYRITEMAASRAEQWVIKAFLAISASGVEVSDEARANGAAGAIAEGMAGFLRISPDKAIPLLDEMMGCVEVFDAHHKDYRPLLEDDDIEEIATRFMLRAEVVELHTGFPVAAALSTLGAAAKRSLVSSATPTSPPASEPSSEAV